MSGPLEGLLVLDLSRILAGPTCTQLFGDLGATVLKVERPGKGDDTRGWGPPFLKDDKGAETRESAYYLSSNRNKRSLAIDIATEAGAALIRDLACRADVLIENYKLGDLERRGLGYEALSALNPRLIYCSISGFGRTGPAAHRAGYDFLIQGMGGIMSVTGAADGEPMKTGVGIADIVTGLYAASGILAALRERERSGRGQQIDLALFDTQLSWLANQGTAWLVSGEEPQRLGNAHPTIVPYATFPASDGDFIIACGNDSQFAKLCTVLGAPEWAEDARFATNAGRVTHRGALVPLLRQRTITQDRAHWIAALERCGVPCGPVNTIPEAFAEPTAIARGARVTMDHPLSGTVDLIGNPLKFGRTPVAYRRAPPLVGADTRAMLAEHLGLDDAALEALSAAGTIPPREDA